MKKFLKITLISAGILATATGILGRSRIQALAGQAKSEFLNLVDDQIDTRAALETQLAGLQERLPRELNQLRGELTQVLAESKEAEREASIARRVVELASQDRESLEEELAVSEAHATAASYPSPSLRAADHRRLTERLIQARSTESMYINQVQQLGVQLEVLQTQRDHLVQIIQDREAEYAEFLESAAQLRAEVDAIERSERLIEWLEERETALAKHSKTEAASLDHLLGNLAQVRQEQNETLSSLTQQARLRDYERTARREAGLTGAQAYLSALEASNE